LQCYITDGIEVDDFDNNGKTVVIIFSWYAAQRGLWPPRPRGFLIKHNYALQLVGLL
jgi:hypothetical protein